MFRIKQDYLLERSDAIDDDFNLTVDSAEEFPVPRHYQNFLARTNQQG